MERSQQSLPFQGRIRKANLDHMSEGMANTEAGNRRSDGVGSSWRMCRPDTECAALLLQEADTRREAKVSKKGREECRSKSRKIVSRAAREWKVAALYQAMLCEHLSQSASAVGSTDSRVQTEYSV